MKARIAVKGSISSAVKMTMQQKRLLVANAIAKAWRGAVHRSPFLSNRAKHRYANAITPYKTRPGAYINDVVSLLLERGWERFDMKPGLLKGRLYRVIPIPSKDGGKPSFRTVSQKSSPMAWIHPGFRGARVVAAVRERMQEYINEALRNE